MDPAFLPASDTLAAPTVLLIEDDEDVGTALLRGLQKSGFDARLATTGAIAIALKASFKPSIVLVDLKLPDISGVALIKWLVAQDDCGVIVVSGLGGEADRIVGLELGADDYVVKPPLIRELAARIRAVHRRTRERRELPAVSAVTMVGALRVDHARHAVYDAGGERIALTTAEFTALDRLCKAHGAVVTRDELSQAALHRSWRPEDRSVDQLILALRKKLTPDSESESLIQSVRGTGYMLCYDLAPGSG